MKRVTVQCCIATVSSGYNLRKKVILGGAIIFHKFRLFYFWWLKYWLQQSKINGIQEEHALHTDIFLKESRLFLIILTICLVLFRLIHNILSKRQTINLAIPKRIHKVNNTCLTIYLTGKYIYISIWISYLGYLEPKEL